MTLESCNTVRVTKRYRKLIPGLWNGNGERSWSGQRWHLWHVVLSADDKSAGCHIIKVYISSITAFTHLYTYNLDLWHLTVKTFSTIPIYMVNTCCSSRNWSYKVWANDTASSQSPLAASPAANHLQNGSYSIQVSSWPGAALPHRALYDDIRRWQPTPTICQRAPARHPTNEDKLRWPQLLCLCTNCVEQSAIRFAVYGYLAEHFQEQTENISVWRWRTLTHLLHLANFLMNSVRYL